MDSYQIYKAGRQSCFYPQGVISAIDAWQAINYARGLAGWKKRIDAPRGFYADSNGLAHTYIDAHGICYDFKIEADYDYGRADCIEGQGYKATSERRVPELAQHGEFTRHSGKGLEAAFDLGDRDYSWFSFDCSEKWVRQFYDNRKHGKHEAYTRMVAQARAAIGQDVKNAKADYYCCTITAYGKDGLEVASTSCWGVHEDEALSGAFFYEQWPEIDEEVRGWRDRQAETFVCAIMEARPDMYLLYA